jgi:hypothetical protein
MSRRQCEGCDGRGVRAPASPSCKIDAARGRWTVVERCDTCERFADDLAAAHSLFRIAGWFECRNGALHALANVRTRRSRQLRADMAESAR